MLDNTIIEQLKSIFATLQSDIAIRMRSRSDDDRAPEMLEFLRDVAAASPYLSVETEDASTDAPEFEIVKGGTATAWNSPASPMATSSPRCCSPCSTPTARARTCPTQLSQRA